MPQENPSCCLAAFKVEIDVLVVVDTDRLKAVYPNPSKKKKIPTKIEPTSDPYHFIFCHDPRGSAGGQATTDLHVHARVGDFFSLTGTSIYANSDSAALVYGITTDQGIFSNFCLDVVAIENAVMPDPQTTNGLPPARQPRTYSNHLARVRRAGQASLELDFALYSLAANGQTQELYGYFSLPSTITITTPSKPAIAGESASK